MSGTRENLIKMVKTGNEKALSDMGEEMKKFEGVDVAGHGNGKCYALPVLKSQQRANQQVMDNQETMIDLILNGSGNNPKPGGTLRLATPFGKAEIPGAYLRDATRFLGVCVLGFLIWFVWDMKRDHAAEQKKTRDEMKKLVVEGVEVRNSIRRPKPDED
jgi:hypothetical protein